MKTFLLVVCCFVAAVAAVLSLPPWAADIAQLNGLNDDDLVKHFKTNVKNCRVSKDDASLKKNLRKHLEKISAKAAENPNVAWGLSCMSAFSEEEFSQQFLTLKPASNPNSGNNPSLPAPPHATAAAVPSRKKRQTSTATVDWRTKGYVTAVKDQGQCGSCWTFSAVGAMEGAIFKKTGKLPVLSEQNLVDCVNATSGSDGCNGGWPTDAYDYVKQATGIDTGASYPYTAVQGKCAFNKANSAGVVTSYAYAKMNNETDLEIAVRTQGPLSAAIDATDIQNYKSGIFKCNTTKINHAILIVGYGTDSTKAPPQNYWIVKNSWGTSWGESGYIRIAKNANNTCGIAYGGNYPIA